jgi:hypothetical protein
MALPQGKTASNLAGLGRQALTGFINISVGRCERDSNKIRSSLTIENSWSNH